MAVFCTLSRAAAVMAIALTATPAHAQSEEGLSNDIPSNLRLLLGTEAVLHSVDMFTTVHTLRLGGIEGNPLLEPFSQRPVALVAVSGAFNVLQAYTITKLHRRHPKVAVAWTLILIGAETFAVTNNIRAAGRLQRTPPATR